MSVCLFLGYFVLLPELLGGRNLRSTPNERWIVFASISGLLSVPAVIAYVIGGPAYPWVKPEPFTFLSALFCLFLISLLCFGISPRLFEKPIESSSDDRLLLHRLHIVTRSILAFFRWLAVKLSPRLCLGVGALLVFSSLLLPSSIEMSLGTSNGYQIVAGDGEWISEPVFLARWIYVVALIVATISIAGVLAWPRFKKLLSSPVVLSTVTVLIASCALFLISAVWIFPVPKLILFEPFFSSPSTILLLVIQTTFWVIPVIMWLWYAVPSHCLPAG
jgi:hypothetical protein